jgi:hypothetical protein
MAQVVTDADGWVRRHDSDRRGLHLQAEDGASFGNQFSGILSCLVGRAVQDGQRRWGVEVMVKGFEEGFAVGGAVGRFDQKALRKLIFAELPILAVVVAEKELS